MNQEDLWNLSPEEFNKWRQEHDLPCLLKFFKEALPLFPQWLAEYGITDADFCAAPHTGEWFIGSTSKCFVTFEERDATRFSITSPTDLALATSRARGIPPIVARIEFLPYLRWGQQTTGKTEFIQWDKTNNQYSDAPVYGSWTGGVHSQAYLFRTFPVLKLGQIQLSNGILIAPRNLDFVDIDALVISGEFHGSYALSVNFSSCRSLRLEHGMLHHVTFRNSVVSEFQCRKGTMQDFLFYKSDVNRFSCSQSTINGLTLIRSSFRGPLINQTEVQRFSYTPDLRYKRYKDEVDVYRRMRMVFQNIGRRSEAQHYYYLERCYERKTLWSPYLDNQQIFPKRSYYGRLATLLSQWKHGRIDTREAMRRSIGLVFFYTKIWTIPKFALRAIMFKAKYFNSLVSFLVWGYGLRFMRVIGFAFFSMTIFALVYLFTGPTAGNYSNSIYLSMVTFTTLGYGDIQPVGSAVKLICASEALLGVITVGLIIGSISKRVDY